MSPTNSAGARGRSVPHRRYPPELRERALALYQSGEPLASIASAVGAPTTTVCGWARAAGLSRDRSKSHRIYPESTRLESAALYKSGLSTIEVGKRLGVSHRHVAKWLRQDGVGVRTHGQAQRVRRGTWINEEAFAPDALTPVGAYWLGFIAADGCVFDNTLQVAISAKDGDHLRSLHEWIGGTLHLRNRSGARYGMAVFQITSARLVDDLAFWGIHPRKSFDLEWPRALPEGATRDFVRGYVDGDGSFYVKSRSNSPTFSAIGSVRFIQALANEIRNACCVGGCQTVLRRYTHPMMQYDVGGRFQVGRIHDWLYTGASIALERKARFSEVLRSLRRANDQKEVVA